ncbi:MAG: hypothetical protein ACREXP_03215 [Steroidobacteraceae bacterium]
MNARNLVYVLAILFATAAISADNKGSGTISGTVNGAEIGKAAPKQSDKDQPPPHATCLSQCASNEQRCSREVRQARTQCQRVAANGGRDVFSGRPAASYNGIDYGAFCNYFANPGVNCRGGYYSSSCQRRLAYRHGICLDAMNNIASLRYDCYRTERDANNQCREDLRECKTSCQ